MAKELPVKRFSDFDVYVEAKRNLDQLNRELVSARSQLHRTSLAVSEARAKMPPGKSHDDVAHEEEVAALVVGLDKADGGIQLAIQTAEAAHKAAERTITRLTDAVDLQTEVLGRMKAGLYGEVFASWQPLLRRSQARQLAAEVEVARAHEEYVRLHDELTEEGLSVSGDYGLMIVQNIGRLGEAGSAIRSLIDRAAAAGVSVPELPEIAASNKAIQAEVKRRQALDEQWLREHGKRRKIGAPGAPIVGEQVR